MSILATWFPSIFRIATNGVLNFTKRGVIYAAIAAALGAMYGVNKVGSMWDDYQESKEIAAGVKLERDAGNIRATQDERSQARVNQNRNLEEKINEDPDENTVHVDYIR